MDKVSFNPRSIRGLGNIVSPKTVSDFGEYNSQIISATDTVNSKTMTVYQSSYRKTEKLVLSYDGFMEYTEELLTFPVKATLYNTNGRYYVGKVLKCIVNNDTVLTGTTNSRGEVTFNIPVVDTGLYTFTVQYTVTNNNRVSGCDASGRVMVGDLNSIRLLSEHEFIQSDETNELVCILEGIITENETIPVPDMLVSFYEEYIMTNLKVSSSRGHVLQDGDVVSFTARLSDEDGSAIPGEPVSFYEEYESGDLQITNTAPEIATGGTLAFTARLTNTEGGAIQGETVKFYEDYIPTSLRLSSSMKQMETGDNCTFTANIRDSDGSIVQVPGTIVSFYEKYVLSNILLSASDSVMGMDELVSFSAKVSDEDGSSIPGQQVLFYEEFDYGDLDVDAVPNPFTVDDEVTISALLRDSDGSRVYGPGVHFTMPIPDSSEYSMVLDVEADVMQTDDTVELSATVTDDEESPVADVGVFFYADGDRLPEEVIVPVDTDVLTLTVDDDSISLGESVTLTGVLTDLSSEPIEDATVIFYDGTSLIGSDTTDSNGSAEYTYTPSVAGSLVLRAKSDDTSSNVVTVTVAKLSSTVSLSAASSTIIYGSDVSLSGTLSVGSGESVKIYQGDTLIDTVTTTTGGAFSKSVSGLGAGSYTFKAVYDGNASYNGSNSGNVSITVSKATPTISLASSKAGLVVGESFVLSGTLSVGTGQQVKIYQGSSVLDTVSTGTGGAFSKSITTVTSGSFTYKAVFEGDNNYNSVTSSNVSVSVVEPAAPASISLTSTASILSYYDGDSCTLSATVLDDDDYPVEDAVVEFFNGTVSMGTVETGNDGVAQMGYAAAGAGDVTFTVECGLLQETYSIEDCIDYDSLTSNHNKFSVSGGVSATYNDTGLSVLGTSTANSYYMYQGTVPTNYIFECDVVSMRLGRYDASTELITNYCGISNISQTAGAKTRYATFDTNYSFINYSDETRHNPPFHLKVEINNGNCTYFIDDVQVHQRSCGQSNLGFKTYSNRGMVIKNMKIKPL